MIVCLLNGFFFRVTFRIGAFAIRSICIKRSVAVGDCIASHAGYLFKCVPIVYVRQFEWPICVFLLMCAIAPIFIVRYLHIWRFVRFIFSICIHSIPFNSIRINWFESINKYAHPNRFRDVKQTNSIWLKINGHGNARTRIVRGFLCEFTICDNDWREWMITHIII